MYFAKLFCALLTVCLHYTHTQSLSHSLIIHHQFIPHFSLLLKTFSQSYSSLSFYLLRNPNNPTRRPPARIARSLALLMPALAQIVRAAMHDDCAAQHAFGPDELDLLVCDGALGVALAVRFEVAEVADVSFGVGGGAVGFGEGVDCVVCVR